MKASDTVMSGPQIGDIMQPCVSPTAQGVIVAQTQAGITWKAGIQEVVEWIKGHSRYTGCDSCGYYTISLEEWQAKLKEWGIE